MATKTISLSEDAYERLKSLKEENESFSDVVRRVTKTGSIERFHGALSESTADEVEDRIKKKRKENRKKHSERVKKVAKDLE